jgi:hypothetical protein
LRGQNQRPGGPIEPGTIGKIHVEINTTHIRDSYNKEINVTTNDPNKGAFILTVNATVRETLSITPPYINLGSISVNSKISQPIKVETRERVP